MFELNETMYDCTHAKFNHIIDNDNVNCDLGIMIEVEGEQQFEAQYTSAVVAKSNLKDYSESEE